MIRNILRHGFHRLLSPIEHELRRCMFRYRNPETFRRLQDLRKVETDIGYSLKPFDDHRCIFVHIPKCAGMSVCKSLFGNLAGGHNNMATYQKVFSARKFHNYFKFTFVRNPWDRLVSAYFFLKNGGFYETDRKWAEENLSGYTEFEIFVKRWVTRDNVQSWIHFRPKYTYICTRDDTPMVDFIAYYENLEENFYYIRNRIGVSAKLLSLNVTNSRRKDYKSYYSDETRDIVADVFQEDIRIFGYNFDNSLLKKQLSE